MDLMDLKGMSKQQLRRIANRANRLANDLEQDEPSYDLALANGIKDRGYDTTANGYVENFSGETVITMDNGKRWKAIGHGPKGDARYIDRQGYIEFIPIDD